MRLVAAGFSLAYSGLNIIASRSTTVLLFCIAEMDQNIYLVCFSKIISLLRGNDKPCSSSIAFTLVEDATTSAMTKHTEP